MHGLSILLFSHFLRDLLVICGEQIKYKSEASSSDHVSLSSSGDPEERRTLTNS